VTVPEDQLTYIHRSQHVPTEQDASATSSSWEVVLEGLAEIGVQSRNNQVGIEKDLNNTEANQRAFFVSPTFTGAADSPQALNTQATFAPSVSIANVFGFLGIAKAAPGSGVTISNHQGGFVRTDYNDVAGAVTVGVGLEVAAPVVSGALKPGTQRGVRIANQGAAGMTTAVGLRIDAQSGASNNYVFDLPADATDPTGGGGAATGRVPCLIGGVTRYIAYY